MRGIVTRKIGEGSVGGWEGVGIIIITRQGEISVISRQRRTRRALLKIPVAMTVDVCGQMEEIPGSTVCKRVRRGILNVANLRIKVKHNPRPSPNPYGS